MVPEAFMIFFFFKTIKLFQNRVESKRSSRYILWEVLCKCVESIIVLFYSKHGYWLNKLFSNTLQ